MDFLIEHNVDVVDESWFLSSKEESSERDSSSLDFKSLCKRKNCQGTLKCIGLNPVCNVDPSSREEKPVIHGACFTCSECGDKPQRRAAWIRYCSLCDGAFAENGFFQHHGGISSRKGEKKLEKRSAAHKKALYLKLNELTSKFPYGEKTSELTLETMEKEIPLLPMEQQWLFASLHFPSTTESVHLATMSSGWVQSAICFVEDMKQVRRLTLDDLMKLEKENRILIKKKVKKKETKVLSSKSTNSSKKRRRSDMEQEEDGDDIVAVVSSLPSYETIDSDDTSDTSDPDEMDGLPLRKRVKVDNSFMTINRWYGPEGSPRGETFFEETFGVLSDAFGQDDDDDLDMNSEEVFSVLCKGIDGHFVFSKNPTKLKNPIGSY